MSFQGPSVSGERSHRFAESAEFVPRAVCSRCQRPSVVCYCAHLPSLPTRTKIMLLRHARERHVPIGTAHMAHLALPDSQLFTGTDFSQVREVFAAARAKNAYVLFPSRDARDVTTLDAREPLTLFVVDGTWALAQKLLRLNPMLAALPRVAFVPEHASEYRIRKEPSAECVSTIEALVEVLRVLEPDGERFAALRKPFRAMVDTQVRYVREVGASRHRSAATIRKGRRRPTIGEDLASLWERIVFVQGEANGWSLHDPNHEPPELVHWSAFRPSTGKVFDEVIMPRRKIAPSTPNHVEISSEELLHGQTVARCRSAWQEFVRPGDVFVHWGVFHVGLAREEAFDFSETSIDLRRALRQSIRPPCGKLEEWAARFGPVLPEIAIRGRAGRRLRTMVAIAEGLVASAHQAKEILLPADRGVGLPDDPR